MAESKYGEKTEERRMVGVMDEEENKMITAL